MPEPVPTCDFRISNHEFCEREPMSGERHCVFHAGKPEASAEIGRLIDDKNGDWRRFKFPAGLHIFNTAKKGRGKIDFEINLTEAMLASLEIEETDFAEPFNLSNIRCEGPTSFRDVSFAKDCTLTNAILASVDLRETKFEGKLVARGLRCRGDFRFVGTTGSETNFNEATFEGAAQFKGSRTVRQTLGSGGQARSDKINHCLANEVHFNDVTFFNPSQSAIRLSDFRTAHVAGTNFEGVELVDIEWPIGMDGRRKIWDDLWAFDSGDKASESYFVQRIASQYRNLRRTHERQKNFSVANDFYVGEMKTKQRGVLQLSERLVLIIYQMSCYYGTGPFRALLVFALLAFFYGFIAVDFTESEFPSMNFGTFQDFAGFVVDMISWGADRVFAGLRQIIPGGGASNQTKIDVTFRILGALQFAMLVITFRNMVKRG